MATADEDVVDGEVEEQEAGMQLVPHAQDSELARTDALTVADLVARRDIVKAAMAEAMEEGVHYGKIPGVSKPTLYKPGAEALSVLFKLAPLFPDNRQHVVQHADGHLDVRSTCVLVHYPTGLVVAEGVGMASTRESKYAYRNAQRLCPNCQQPNLRKSKYPPRNSPAGTPGGWWCPRDTGCGMDFQHDDNRITTQVVGKVPNPDLPDAWNTVLKMGSKRSYVDAMLHATGASDLFTQDVEDSNAPPPDDTPFEASTGNEAQPPQQPPAQQPAAQAVDEWAALQPMEILQAMEELWPTWDWRRMFVRASNQVYPVVASWATLGQLPEASRNDLRARLRVTARAMQAGGSAAEHAVMAAWAQGFDGHAIEVVAAPVGPAPQPPAQPPLPTPEEVEAGAAAGQGGAGAMRVPTKDEYELARQVLDNPAGYGANDSMVAHATSVVALYEAQPAVTDSDLVL